MQHDPIDSLASELAARIELARGELMARMRSLGLEAADGWRVGEEIRSTMSGTVVVLKPVHIRLDGPEIEATVQVGHDGHPVERKS